MMSEIWVFATELLDDLERGEMTELTGTEKTMLKYILADWLERTEGDEHEGNKER